MRRSLTLALLLASLFVAGAARAACPVIPYIFDNGSVWDSVQINANFASVHNCVIAGVFGPNPTTPGDVVVWNSTDGTLVGAGPGKITDTRTTPLTVDAAALTASSRSDTTSQEIYNQAVMGGVGLPFNDYAAVKGVTTANPLSTINIASGVTGYTLNNTVPIGQRTQTAAVNSIAVCAVDGSQCWGYNAIVSDNPTLANNGITAGTGKFLTNEFDLNITSPNSGGNGLAVGGTALPTNITLAFNGFGVNKFWGSGGFGTGTALWANGLITEDACCAIGIKVGATAATGSDIPSQPVFLGYRDAGGTGQAVALTGQGGKLFAGGTASFGFATPNFPNTSTTAFIAGAMASAGTNVESQVSIWGYFDAGSVLQNYSMGVNNTRTMVFASSVGGAVAKFDFEGGLSVNGNVGVSCTAGTVVAATMIVVNGLVVHC